MKTFVMTLHAAWQLLRPRTLVVIYLHFMLFAGFAGIELTEWRYILLSFAAIALWYMHAVAINDLSDEAVDAINLPKVGQTSDRSLLNATVSRRQLWTGVMAITVLLVAVCFMIRPQLALAALVMVGLNCIYSLPPVRLSGRGVLAQAALPLGYVAFPASIVMVQIQVAGLSWWMLLAGVYVLFMGRLFLKDIRDEKGDALEGKHTYLVRHGLVRTLTQSACWMFAGSAMMVYGSAAVHWIYGVAWILSAAMIVRGLRGIYRSRSLDVRLLYVAVTGRAGSYWLFCAVIAAWLPASYGMAAHFFAVVMATALFGFGFLQLFDEITLTQVRQAAKRRQPEL